MNSLNRLNKTSLLVVTLSVVMLNLSACKKKDRLSNSTFQFAVSPAAKAILPGGTVTLTLTSSVASDAVWTVEETPSDPNTDVGDLNTNSGNQVVFTANALGDAIVSATFNGVVARAQIGVVSYIPPVSDPDIFNIYTDAGLPAADGSITPDIDLGGLTLTEPSSGYTPEGIEYLHATGATTNSFWGVTFDDTNTNQNKNLSAYTNGDLKFSIRLGRALGGFDVLRVAVIDSGSTANTLTSDLWPSFDESSTEWQQIVIPLNSFAGGGANFNAIEVPFQIVGQNLSSGSLSFDVDAVRWEK